MNSSSRHIGKRSGTVYALAWLLILMQAGSGVGTFAATTATIEAGDEARQVSTETRDGRLAVFDDVWRTIHERYYDPAMHGVDWEALRAALRPRAGDARGQEELYAVLRRMIKHLRDPHTRVNAPDERSEWHRPRFLTIGVRVREVDGEVVVTEVERGAEAERAGVRAGDAVASIDGEAVSIVLARRMEEGAIASSAASMTARLFATAKLFDGPRDSFVAVIFKGADGHLKQVRLRRVLRSRTPFLNVRRVGNYGVVEFSVFTPEIAAEFARGLKGPLKNVRGIVLDLRDNGGGEAEAMIDIASFFLPPGKRMGSFTDRAGRVHLEPQTRAAMLSAADAINVFRGSVVVLSGTRTASAAEVFVAALRENNRATVFGENTCGCVLGIRRRHTLPDGGLLEISEVDYRTTSGARLEGVGVAPDEQITLTRRDLRARHDRALERALEFLKASGKKLK